MTWILSENRYLRFFSFALFYVAQGLPIGLISIALPAWLAEQGVGAADIATFVAISGLPWGFKLVAGPIMDRFSFLPMGRRRPWVVAAQFGLLLSIIVMGIVPDPAGNVMLLTWVAFAVNCCAAVQDVAVDGMAIDVLPFEERGRANAFMAFGQVAGYSASGALSATLLIWLGLAGAAWTLALGIGFIFIWGVLVRERENEKMLPWTRGEASARSIALQAEDWLSIFANLIKVMFLPASLILITVTLCWRGAGGFWLTAAPVIAVQQLGFESTVYSQWTAAAGFTAATLGLLLGPLIDRTGARYVLMVGLAGLGILFLSTGLLESWWTLAWFPVMVVTCEALFGQAIFISFIALHMNICWTRVSATQFAIYMAWANLARSIGAAIYGEVEADLTSGQEFLAMSAMCFVGVALLSAVNLAAHQRRIERLDAEAVGRPAEASSS